ncbi:MAG: hypothetical protein ACTH8P_03065 [Ewingella sp.]
MLILQIIFTLSIFSISGCSILSSKAEYIPDGKVLESAVIDVPYLSRIYILGGGVVHGRNHQTDGIGLVTPNDAGISLRNCQYPEWRVKQMKPRDSNNYNCIEVYGTPAILGVVKINIKGKMYGSMIAPAGNFSKDYVLNIVNSNRDL